MAGFAPRGRTELRRLLDVGDLDHAIPSTLWDRTGEGTWRTGLAGDDQPAWQAAAHAAGSVTAWRTFTSEDGHALEVQVVPLATETDAADALAAVTDPTRRWRRAGGHRDHDQVEAAVSGTDLVVAIGSGDAWEPTDLAAVVTAQLAQLRRSR